MTCHRGGRSVLIVEFGSGLRIVYKPKPLRVDQHFQELLEWVNARGFEPAFRTQRIVSRGTYGWSEFIEGRSCTCEEELHRFYQRQGGYLALLCVLTASDVHSENVIADGEHPMLIDLEALFQPPLPGTNPETRFDIGRLVASSVLRVMLLPMRVWGQGMLDGVDVSGLGGASGQPLAYGAPSWSEEGTDDMRYAVKEMTLPPTQNRPALDGTEADAVEYAESIVRGFRSLYALLERDHAELLDDGGPLARFAGDEVRVVLRSTQRYWDVISQSFHPDVLHDELDRMRFVDRLWTATRLTPFLARTTWSRNAGQPRLASICPPRDSRSSRRCWALLPSPRCFRPTGRGSSMLRWRSRTFSPRRCR